MTRTPAAGDASELQWLKSSYSSSNEPGDCIEVAATPDTIHVRDSKSPQGPCLNLSPGTWVSFVAYASCPV